VRPNIAIIYNQPYYGRFVVAGETKAEASIADTVRAVHRALTDLEYPVIKFPLPPPLEQAKDQLKRLEADLVFNLFEGFDDQPETEADIAYALSDLGLTYTGCPGDTLSLALDKAKTNAILDAAGIGTPNCQLLTAETLSEFNLNYPCIVKPAGEDSSHGLTEESVVYDADQLEKQVIKISNFFGGKALVEEFVDGREFNVSVIGDDEPSVLPISEIAYSLPEGMPQILTFAAKWDTNSTYFQGTKPICPADINDDLRNKIERIAMSVFKLLNSSGSGYARLDLRLDAGEKVKVLEFNPNPDITPGNGAARQARAAGMTYKQFIEKIVILALKKHVDETRYPTYDWQRQASYTENTEEYA
jgi:D-alanine-D-alanine ligase